ncbi:MAG: synthase gamma chain [Firmicutes bacterium]|nr:synthase gamma chain [Bacillota bacterium]
MPNALDLRRRIKGVRNIQKITRAMKMVAAVRLRKAQERVKDNQLYFQGVKRVIEAVLKSGDEFQHPLFTEREIVRTGYLVIGADKGLAGSYGSNLVKAVQRQLNQAGQAGLVVVGRKVRDYFERRKAVIDKAYIGISEKPEYRYAAEIGAAVSELYTSGRYDKVDLIYTEFCSSSVQKITVEQLLPLVCEAAPILLPAQQIYEPSMTEVLAEAAVKYLEAAVYRALIHAAASEVASRLQAMSLATDNAQDLISQLELDYNKVRQANITREISEIVGGAEALR